MIPLFQEEIVEKRGWMTDEEFADAVAVSQGLPGVIAINMGTYTGHMIAGTAGAVSATVGVTLPSFVIIIMVVEFLDGLAGNVFAEGALFAIRVSAAAMILFSAMSIGKQVIKTPFHLICAVAAFIFIAVLNVPVAIVIAAGFAAGIIYGKIKDRKGGRSEK